MSPVSGLSVRRHSSVNTAATGPIGRPGDDAAIACAYAPTHHGRTVMDPDERAGMAAHPTQPASPPTGSTPTPDSYALYVTEGTIDCWQYRHSIADPEGRWAFVRTFDRAENPRLSLTRATLGPPTDDGYWVYTGDYECFLGCA